MPQIQFEKFEKFKFKIQNGKLKWAAVAAVVVVAVAAAAAAILNEMRKRYFLLLLPYANSTSQLTQRENSDGSFAGRRGANCDAKFQ